MAGWGDGCMGRTSGWGGFTAFTSSVDEASTGTDAVVSAISRILLQSLRQVAATDAITASNLYDSVITETATGTQIALLKGLLYNCTQGVTESKYRFRHYCFYCFFCRGSNY